MGLSIRVMVAILELLDIESKLLFEVNLFSRNWTVPAVAFLHWLTEKQCLADIEFLVEAGGYLAARGGYGSSKQPNYQIRNHIERWFHTVNRPIDRFQSF